MANRQRASMKEALEAATAGMANPPQPASRPGETLSPGPQSSSPPASHPDSPNTSTEKKGRGEAVAPNQADAEKKTDTSEEIPSPESTPSPQNTIAQDLPRTKQEPSQHKEGHQKTSTGYVTAAGEKIVRLTLHMTPAQKRALKMKMLKAGHDSPSAYLIDVLDLS